MQEVNSNRAKAIVNGIMTKGVRFGNYETSKKNLNKEYEAKSYKSKHGTTTLRVQFRRYA